MELGLRYGIAVLFFACGVPDTLAVTDADLLLLRSRQPFLISHAIVHILAAAHRAWCRWHSFDIRNGFGLDRNCIIWTRSHTQGAGRLFQEQTKCNPFAQLSPARKERGSCVAGGIEFLSCRHHARRPCRLRWRIAARGPCSSKSDPSPGSATLIFLTIVMLIWLAWAVLNWFLSIAAIFVVAEGRDTFGAVASAVDFAERAPGLYWRRNVV